ncbi:LOW QUALITY PROTEIN: lipase 1-like [Colias croceus]|uniref:LOW QUALITY PROTEIN: lipase 1-like n=1 Tax=Colias crocea TaxID=72248 RepID=UPI001E27A225|nr:LOW QUALITY PROTEIN: lipase 1-like [Colias croceus]
MHGLLGSADDWISPGSGFGLGFLLADKSYDVWMGNARGINIYSNRNTGMETSEKKFWDFSWHEIGVFVVPAMIDHVLYITNNKKLIYIGYSQGNTAFLVMCSMRPEYNEKISLMISLSALLQRAFCGDTVSAFIVCQHIVFLLGGVNYSQINMKRFPVICNHFPSGSSVKQIVHYGQLIVSGHFRNFDYGSLNLLKYGFPEPPIYPVEKITAPVAIFFSKGDWLANKKDVQKLQSKLPNQILFYKNKHFNHFDFLWLLMNDE